MMMMMMMMINGLIVLSVSQICARLISLLTDSLGNYSEQVILTP